MFIMKTLLLLVVCLTVNVVQMNCDCEPEKLEHVDAAKLAGTWRLIYVHKDHPYFKNGISNVVEKMDFYPDIDDEEEEGEPVEIGDYVGNVTYLDSNNEQQVLEGKWEIVNTEFTDLSKKRIDGDIVPWFYIKAAVYDKYYIRRPKDMDEDIKIDFTEVFIRDDKCGAKEVIKAIKEGISKLCYKFEDFEEDKKKKCSS